MIYGHIRTRNDRTLLVRPQDVRNHYRADFYSRVFPTRNHPLGNFSKTVAVSRLPTRVPCAPTFREGARRAARPPAGRATSRAPTTVADGRPCSSHIPHTGCAVDYALTVCASRSRPAPDVLGSRPSRRYITGESRASRARKNRSADLGPTVDDRRRRRGRHVTRNTVRKFVRITIGSYAENRVRVWSLDPRVERGGVRVGSRAVNE